MDKRWYVIHTYSGHENKVKHYIESAASNDPNVSGKVAQVVVPMEEVVEMKDGRKTTVTRKFLPSYVLVEMELTKEATSGGPLPLRATSIHPLTRDSPAL